MDFEWSGRDKYETPSDPSYHSIWYFRKCVGDTYDQTILCVLENHDGKYWIGPTFIPGVVTGEITDIGPFDNLKDAKTAAETMVNLRQFPSAWGSDYGDVWG